NNWLQVWVTLQRLFLSRDLCLFVQSPDTLAPSPCHSPSVLLPAPTIPTTTKAAALERFTVNFTITNLPYTSDLENPDSAKFRATRRVMNTLVSGTSLGHFLHCPVFCRPGSHRDETRVDAVCTYSKEPSAAPLDRVGLYHEVSNKTRGITQLGPYSLDKDSLYVNDCGDMGSLQTFPWRGKLSGTCVYPSRALTLLLFHLVTPHLCFFQLPPFQQQQQLWPSGISPSTSPSPTSPTLLTWRILTQPSSELHEGL
uniref:SEA domain-containing protein n=1 Tax=Catharus ustulatus TaxID=91951 RepID=A0A8C3UKA0_CATUS